ncbi:MAG: type II secretion system protein N [Nitrospira sp.]
MIRSLIARRMIGGAYLIIVSLIIAHGVNAFVADALNMPLAMLDISSSYPEPIMGTDLIDPQQRIEHILESGLFELPPVAQRRKAGAPPPGPPPPPIEAARKVALLGSVLGTDGTAMAIVEDLATKHQEIYRLGMQVSNVGTLHSVEKDRVLFKNGPSEEWLDLAALRQQTNDGGTAPVSQALQARSAPARQVLDRREVTAALNDPTRLMTQAQAVPYLTDGKLDGFRLHVMPMGFFDKIGLRTNDVIQRINGVELRDPGMLLTLFQQLRNENIVRVDLVRNSQRQSLTYEIR